MAIDNRIEISFVVYAVRVSLSSIASSFSWWIMSVLGFSPINLLREFFQVNMPFVKVYIHFVWFTKNREPFLDSPVLRKKVWGHMKENAKSKGIFIDSINGYQDHCHCLISLGVDQTMSKIMQLIKGESSYWINKNKLCKQKFEWQEEYFAISVSDSMVDKVREYIKNQEEHHKEQPFQQEHDQFILKYGIQNFKDSFHKDKVF